MDQSDRYTSDNDSFHDIAIWQIAVYAFFLVVIAAILIIRLIYPGITL